MAYLAVILVRVCDHSNSHCLF